MNDIQSIKNATEEFVNELLNKLQMTEITRDEFKQSGLDYRISYDVMMYNDDFLVVKTNDNLRTLNYYGGFEYVDNDDDKYEIGDYVFYSRLSDRVNDFVNAITHT